MDPKSQTCARIVAFGSYFPAQVVTNADMEKIVDTSDQWITERSGIKERRKLAPNEQNSDMAVGASLKALKAAGLEPADIDLYLACTTSADRIMPSMASTVQMKLGGRPGSVAYDIYVACAGWVTGLEMAAAFVKTGQYKNVLVMGSEALSRFVNYKDRGTCVLFGDGAGVSIVQAGNHGDPGEILSVKVHTDGRLGDLLDLPGGGSQSPASAETVAQNLHYIRMQGSEIFKNAVRCMATVCEEILEEQKLKIEDIDWFIPHQANIRIIDAVGKKLNFPVERVALNIHKYGNTSTATIPTCFDEYVQEGKINRGQLVLMTTFGGGLTWAGALIRW